MDTGNALSKLFEIYNPSRFIRLPMDTGNALSKLFEIFRDSSLVRFPISDGNVEIELSAKYKFGK